jgi:hypothetical protein
MAGYDYKCVPVPRALFTGQSGKDSHSAAVEAYETIIKNAAQGGWELDRQDTITSYQQPGCLAGLLHKITGGFIGKTDEEVNHKLLIFKKPL